MKIHTAYHMLRYNIRWSAHCYEKVQTRRKEFFVKERLESHSQDLCEKTTVNILFIKTYLLRGKSSSGLIKSQ